MYAKYIVFAFLLGISALLPAQSADQTRINIRIFPSQVLSIATAKDSQHAVINKHQNNDNKLVASNLYGYQIKLLNEEHTNTKLPETFNDKKNCSSESKLIFSQTSSSIDQKIPTSHLSAASKDLLNKCVTSENDRMLVYLIITQ
ncbi:hypothetical protein NZ698_06765 [Chryseobacterium sp. PBS4-4]|uniref:Uncharacterized protein n=1 Tax=Chryseobacterium edaphi TaxID=2976532 RepID=A0ABT2W3W0_9FLAO|nr:hypothetical protein [Chryseobacterium edaphi]MCU7616893.1 hypothetical protein [Chryseobacterium edaphi]